MSRQYAEDIADAAARAAYRSDSSHSPGPWFAQSYEDETGQPRKIEEPYFFIQLEPTSGARNGDYMSVSGICSEANARLLAAAPDLLDALHDARAFIDGQIDVVDGDYGIPEPNKAMRLAGLIDEAIAKAEGKP